MDTMQAQLSCPQCGASVKQSNGIHEELSLGPDSEESTSQIQSDAGPMVTSEEKYWKSVSLDQPTGIFNHLVNAEESEDSSHEEEPEAVESQLADGLNDHASDGTMPETPAVAAFHLQNPIDDIPPEAEQTTRQQQSQHILAESDDPISHDDESTSVEEEPIHKEADSSEEYNLSEAFAQTHQQVLIQPGSQDQEITDPRLPSETSENFLSDELDAAFDDFEQSAEESSEAANRRSESVHDHHEAKLHPNEETDGAWKGSLEEDFNPMKVFQEEFQKSLSGIKPEPEHNDSFQQTKLSQGESDPPHDPFAAFDRAFEAAVSDNPPPLRVQPPQPTAHLDEGTVEAKRPSQGDISTEIIGRPRVGPSPNISLLGGQSPGPAIKWQHPHSDDHDVLQLLEDGSDQGALLSAIVDFGQWIPKDHEAQSTTNRPSLHRSTDEQTQRLKAESDSDLEEPGDEDFSLEEIDPPFVGFTAKRIAIGMCIALCVGCLIGLRMGPHTGPNQQTAEGRAALAFAKGNQLFQKDQADEALAAYRNAIQEGLPNPAVFRAKGAALAKQRRFKEAAIAYEEYLTRAPNAPDKVEIEASLSKFYAKDESDD